ncbi:MAG: hypothetical protein V4755_16525, partial [Curtobacterium sp.]
SIAHGLATMASAGFEFGGDADQVAHDVRTMWEQLGRPVGAFDAAARAIAELPQRPEVPNGAVRSSGRSASTRSRWNWPRPCPPVSSSSGWRGPVERPADQASTRRSHQALGKPK